MELATPEQTRCRRKDLNKALLVRIRVEQRIRFISPLYEFSYRGFIYFHSNFAKSVKLVKSYLYLKISLNKQIKGVIYGK